MNTRTANDVWNSITDQIQCFRDIQEESVLEFLCSDFFPEHLIVLVLNDADLAVQYLLQDQASDHESTGQVHSGAQHLFQRLHHSIPG